MKKNKMKKFIVGTLLALSANFCAGQNLEDLFVQIENEIREIKTAVESSYNDKCNIDCGCSLSACKSSLPNPVCTDIFGSNDDCGSNERVLDFDSSVFRSANKAKNVLHQACWTSNLDTTFKKINGENTLVRWQYFGTTDGNNRIYPGAVQEVCNSYDPRVRPWYVAASSGPKDVILVLDVSGSMSSNGRMGLMKEAAISVLETLTLSDYFGIVVFSSNANVMESNLLSATEENIKKGIDTVNRLSPNGGTNFYDAFVKTFNLMKTSKQNERTSSCHTAVLFLTDGENTGNDPLPLINSKMNEFENTVVFSYVLGAQGSINVPKAISCATNGVFSTIPDSGDLVSKMSHYYNYFAALRADDPNPVWVEPYIDAFGAGEMTTASLAVYDKTNDPHKLIGVIGIDLLVSTMKQLEPNYQNLLNKLKFRSSKCSTMTELTSCQMDILRAGDEFGEGNNNFNRCNTDSDCKLNATQVCTIPNEATLCNTQRESFLDETCCVMKEDNTGLIIGAVFGGIAGVCLLFFCCMNILTRKVKKTPPQSKYREEPVYGRQYNNNNSPPTATAVPVYATATAV